MNIEYSVWLLLIPGCRVERLGRSLTLDRRDTVVELISTGEVHISMVIEDTHEKKVMEKYCTVGLR